MLSKNQEAKYRKLIAAAKKASDLAYRPYSNYPVGAAVLTFDGKIYTGCNIENYGFTQTIHAEQTAMAKALSEGGLKRALDAGLTQLDFIEAIAVHAPKGTDPWPCCNCRQSLNEFGLSMKVVGEGKNGSIKCKTLGELIPHAFPMEVVLAAVHGKNWKEQMRRNAGSHSQKKDVKQKRAAERVAPDKRMQLIEAAKQAAELAYCPYSHYPVGAAVLTFDGKIYSGCNIENCGYTQTIHAEQTAMAKAVSEGALQRAFDKGLTQFDFIKSIAVYSPKLTEPWPSCNGRQSLNEFGLSMDVIGLNSKGQIVSKKLKELIPFAFPMESVLKSVREPNNRKARLQQEAKRLP
ncbi:MAG TPA: cytidine deaminase [Candidatus Obscuribacterales bacterium]